MRRRLCSIQISVANEIEEYSHVTPTAIQTVTFHNSQESSDQSKQLRKVWKFLSIHIGHILIQANKEPNSADLRHYLSNALTIKKSPSLLEAFVSTIDDGLIILIGNTFQNRVVDDSLTKVVDSFNHLAVI